MKKRRLQKIASIFTSVIFLFIIDRILKYWAQYGLYHAKIDIIKNWLTFELFKNQQIAFSIPLPQIIIIPLIIIIITILIALFIQRIKVYWGLMEIGLLFMIAGAVSNVYDRLQHGFVIDYLNFYFLPVFNIADVMVGIGVIMIIISMFRKK